MVARIRRDSDHEVVAFDFDAKARQGGREERRDRRATSLADLVKQARAAADGLDHGPGRRITQKTSTSSPSCSTRTTRSSTAATRAGPTTRRARRSPQEEGIHYVDVGTSGGVWGLEVGYCMMVGGPDAAVKRLTPILDVLAPPTTEEHGPGWGHCGPTGAGHYVKMVHNGIEYGMMQAYAEGFELFDASRVRARQRARSPTSGCRAPSSARGCASSPPRPSSRRATTSRRSSPTSTTPARAAGRIEDAIDKRVPTPVITASLFARFESRGQRRLRGARSTPRCAAQFGGHAVKTSRRRSTMRDASGRPDNPLVEGLERLPGPPDDAGHLRRDRRPGQAQAAAGALQPRPRGRAARALQPDRRVAQRDDATRSTARWSPRSIREFSRREPDETVLEALLANVRYVPGTFDDPRSTSGSSRRWTTFDDERRPAAQPRLLPLDRAGVLPGDRRAARRAELERDHATPRSAAIIEKPFGTTLAEAQELNKRRARRSSRSARSSASTTTWARRPSRTCWRSGSPTRCSSRSGTATTSTTSRSPRPRTSAIGTRAGYYDSAGALRDLVQNHMLQLLCHAGDGAAGGLHGRRGPRREGQGPARDPHADAGDGRRDRGARAVHDAAPSAARTSPATCRRRACRRTPTPRPTRRCGWRSTTGAGPACRSICAPASAWRARSPRSRSR